MSAAVTHQPGSTTSARPVVYLHVGAPKTGTTYLQAVLWRNRDNLRRAGLLYPGQNSSSHFRAMQDLRRKPFHEYEDPLVPGAWDGLVAEAAAFSGNTIISHELFSDVGANDVARAMQDLSFAEVHIVYTVRDLGQQIPSVWQEHLKNRHTLSFAEFVGGLRRRELDGQDRKPPWFVSHFWRQQDPMRVLALWARELPPERVHVVTVPPSRTESSSLWERFAQVVGVAPERYTTAVDQSANRSLGVAEANLLRRLNPTLAAQLDWPTYERWIKFCVAGSLLGARADATPISLPAREYEWVLERSKQFVVGLRDAGYAVVGDLDDIVPVLVGNEDRQRHPDEVDDAEQFEAAADAIVGLIKMLARKPRRQQPPAPQEPAVLLRRAASRLGDQYRSVGWVREAYRRGKRGMESLRAAKPRQTVSTSDGGYTQRGHAIERLRRLS